MASLYMDSSPPKHRRYGEFALGIGRALSPSDTEAILSQLYHTTCPYEPTGSTPSNGRCPRFGVTEAKIFRLLNFPSAFGCFKLYCQISAFNIARPAASRSFTPNPIRISETRPA
ncbi:hypothetical protein AUP68_17050 [Ilyonectria robusta]